MKTQLSSRFPHILDHSDTRREFGQEVILFSGQGFGSGSILSWPYPEQTIEKKNLSDKKAGFGSDLKKSYTIIWRNS